MITVQEADKLISKNIYEYPPVPVPLKEAYGMVLREDLVADRGLPPFDRVTMDGIGIDLGAWKEGQTAFLIEGIQKAGIPALMLKDPKKCLEVMTGAVLPQGCDCVIPVEDIEIKDGAAVLKSRLELEPMQCVHRKASDHQAGETLVKKGCRLLASQVAVVASAGKEQVLVSKMPTIAVIGTGDEVVALDRQVEPHQIRQSNSYAMQAALKLSGYSLVDRFHLCDDEDVLRSSLGRMLKSYDVLILSGGVSMGKFDYVPGILAGLGVKEIFHHVKARPGKPLWFGVSEDGRAVFGLPGNPVSTQVGMYRYVLPFLRRSSGLAEASLEWLLLAEDVEIKTDRTTFLPVKVDNAPDGGRLGRPVFFNVSGDYACLTETDGFVELPADTFRFPKGFSARFYRWTF